MTNENNNVTQGNNNTGNHNSGDYNSGCGNSGDRNSGDWNAGDYNSGCLNTNKPPLRIFNKLTEKEPDYPDYFYFELVVLAEPQENGFREIVVKKYEDAWKESFEGASVEDVEKTLRLPNFDYALFEEISGITREDFERRLGKYVRDKEE